MALPIAPVGFTAKIGTAEWSAKSRQTQSGGGRGHWQEHSGTSAHRQEAAVSVPEVAKTEVGTLRQRVWKVGAVVVTTARRVWFHVSTSWPNRDVFVRVHEAVRKFVVALRSPILVVPSADSLPLM